MTPSQGQHPFQVDNDDDLKADLNNVTTLESLSFILLPAGTSIVLPVGYMSQPTGLLHIYL